MTLKTGKFSPEEDELLIANYACKGPTWCSRQLGRGYSSTAGRARILRIKYTGPRQPNQYPMAKPAPKPVMAKPFPPQPEAKEAPPRPVWTSLLKCERRLGK